jgi:LPS export ABC transporter protein LptC
MSILRRIAVLLTGTVFVFACDNDLEVASNITVEKMPALSIADFESIHTDSGKVQIIMKSPLLERYTRETEPYNEFPKGLEVSFFDGKTEPSAFLSSDYAIYNEGKKLWEFRYNVSVRNESNELLETELLFWDEEKDRVYTDRFVKITREDMINTGTGFESDSRLTKTQILKGNAIIYLKDE